MYRDEEPEELSSEGSSRDVAGPSPRDPCQAVNPSTMQGRVSNFESCLCCVLAARLQTDH